MTLKQPKTIKQIIVSEPHKIQEETERLKARLLELLDESTEYVDLWLTSPHPDLGGRTPSSYLKEGKIEVVEALIWAIETGQPE